MMRCLSLWQPWATLVAIGAKQYETRSWSTKYTGPLLIHAGKHTKELEYAFNHPVYRSTLARAAYNLKNIPLGAAICLVDLVGVFRTEEIRESLGEDELAFGNYADKRFAWKLENVRLFPEPIPMQGKQGLFEVDAEMLPPIRDQMRMYHLKWGNGLVECPTCGRSAAVGNAIKHREDCADPQEVVVLANS